MKLILTQQVSGLGEPGDVIEVKDGYGRNYLLPRGYAMKWTRGAERQIESIKKARSAREIASIDHAKEVAQRLAALRVRLSTRAGESGRLFGSVTAGDIASAVKQAGGPDIDKRRIEVGSPIKTLGTHQISVRLHPEVSATVELEVVAA
jgi:large subunit ribosomal protein L9